MLFRVINDLLYLGKNIQDSVWQFPFLQFPVVIMMIKYQIYPVAGLVGDIHEKNPVTGSLALEEVEFPEPSFCFDQFRKLDESLKFHDGVISASK
jgi:hypothetical protein